MRFGPVTVEFDHTVLRPRPWTLALAEWAAELTDATVLLEVGCGAGHIGLAAAVLSRSSLVQVDRSPAAYRWAQHNAAANGLTGLVSQRCGTVADVLAEGERFALVLADPPYVPSSEVDRFPDDPPGAIDGGPDGLTQVRSFLTEVAPHVASDGSLLLQLRGRPQVDALRAWLSTGPPAPALVSVETREYGDDGAVTRLVAPPHP